MSIREDIFTVCPSMADIRRASPNTSGLEDVLGRGGEAPSEGTAHSRGLGSRAERVVMGSIGRIRLNRPLL